MALELHLLKARDGIMLPATAQDAEKLERVKVGRVIYAEWKRQRNSDFHRKYFALLNFAFEHWHPRRIDGVEVEKNFNKFREDLTIRAGFYDQVFDLDGNFELRAKSISFGKMGQDEFEKLYSATINVILKDVLKNYSREDLDQVVDTLLRFDG